MGTTRPTVLLFDIDGTLVTTGGVGRRAIQRTFVELFGRDDALSFSFSGMTDRAIIRAGLRTLGEVADNAQISWVISEYLHVLELEVSSAKGPTYRVHEGMLRALDVAGTRTNVAVGLGTGNVREGARLKLSHVGIYERFRFGGFGCDHESRVELIRIGANRGAEMLGAPVSDCRVVVIGDTPKDIHAAQGVGAECIAVGTGEFSPEALSKAGATHAFPTLAAPGALEVLLDER